MGRVTEIQNNFTGGAAIDPYRPERDEFEISKNLDIYYQPGRVRPYRDVEDYDGGQSDIARIMRSQDGNLYGLTDGTISLYNDAVGTPWQLLVNTGRSLNAGGLGVDEVPMMVEFDDGDEQFIYWWSNINAVGPTIIIDIDRWDVQNAALTTAWAQIAIGGGPAARVFDVPGPGYTHPLSNRCYFALGNEIYGITFNAQTLINDGGLLRPPLVFQVPDTYEIITITHWESYLVVGARSKAGDTDKVYFWDQTNSLADFVKEIPEGRLSVLRNTGSNITAICTQADIDGLLLAYTYTGAEFDLQKSLIKRNIAGDINFRDAAADVRNNTIFFGGIFDDDIGIFRFGLNKYNGYYLTIDRGATDDGSETDILSIEINQDTFTVVYDQPGDISRTENSPDYNLDPDAAFIVSRRFYGDNKISQKEYVSVYVSTISPLGETFTPATQNLYVEYRTDQQTAWTPLGTHDASTSEFAEFTIQNTNISIKPYQYIQFRFRFEGLVQLGELGVTHNTLPRINTPK